MRRFISILVVVCLLVLGPSVVGQPRDDDPRRGEPGTITLIVRSVINHILSALGDSLSPPHP